MTKSIWITMKNSIEDVDEFDINYPDIMTFNINKFKYNYTPLNIVLSEQDVINFPLLMFNNYNTTDYDDIVLWLNNIESKNGLVSGQTILLPNKKDIDDFYLKFTI